MVSVHVFEGPSAMKKGLRGSVRLVATAVLLGLGTNATAQTFISPPDFSGAPVRGDEPGLAQPLPDATAGEMQAGLIWNLRAALNVAALQCQFSPMLGTVRNYNQLLIHQSAELEDARQKLENYFKRKNGKTGPRSFDLYTTRTYNGFSTLYGQLGFCDTAARIGRASLGMPKGQLHVLASQRLRELRNSLQLAGDMIFAFRPSYIPPFPQLSDPCIDKKGRRIKKC